MQKKRQGYINWDEYFMGVALLAAQRSKDPNTQIGCCIATTDNIIVSVGYNGLPRGCDDDAYPWEREGELKETKYPYIVHAELNAILNAGGRDLRGCKLYVALHPCENCAKAIIQSGIKEVIYLSDKYAHLPEFEVSRRLLRDAGVKTTPFTSALQNLTIDFSKK